MAGRTRPIMTDEEREAAAAALRVDSTFTGVTIPDSRATEASLINGIKYEGSGTIPDKTGDRTPTTTPTIPTATPPKEVATPDPGEIPGDLLTSLRRGILTGSQVQGGARTFRGGGAFSSAFKKGATSLRIGTSRANQERSREFKRRKQTNTLGLNLGSSVGLQV